MPTPTHDVKERPEKSTRTRLREFSEEEQIGPVIREITPYSSSTSTVIEVNEIYQGYLE